MNFRHLDGLDTFLENAFAFNNQVVREFQTVHVDVPIHPLRRADDDFFLRRVIGFADGFGFLFGNQFSGEQLLELRLDFGRINRREIIAHFFAHEHPVRADVKHAALVEQAVDEFLDLRINQRFAAADGNHRRITFHGRFKAFFQRHHVLERRGIFADAAAAGAGQVAGMQRFELQDHRELGRLAELVLDDVTGNFFGQRKGKSHNLFYRSQFGGDFRE